MKKTINKIFYILSKVLNEVFPSEEISEEDLINKLCITTSYLPFGHINLFSYQDALVRKLIWSIKFKHNRQQAKLFSRLLYEVLLEELTTLSKMHNFYDPLLIKVPSSKRSLKKRGYDHNKLFLKNLIKSGSIEFRDLLIKTKNTERQSHFKNRKDRVKNAKNSFSIKNKKLLKGRNVILFDDLTTSGATLNECKKVLRNFGAKKILLLTIAK